MSTPSWTPFCTQKPNYKHDEQCRDQQACSNCGQANPFYRAGSPNSVIIVGASSPPAMQLPDRFETLPRGPAQAARRAAIERHFKPAKDKQNAGSGVLSSRQQLVVPRTVFVQTILHYAEIKDISVKTYHKWELIGEYYNDYGNLIDYEAYLYSPFIGTTRMHLPTNLSFNTMQDFIAEIGKSVHNWGSIVNNLNIFEIFVASDFAPQYGPVHIPDSAWELGLTELLVRYFGPVSLGKDKKMFKIFVFIGRYGEDLDTTAGQDPGTTSGVAKRGKAVKKGPKVKKEPEQWESELLAAPARSTRKRSLQDFQLEEMGIGDDQGFVEEGDLEEGDVEEGLDHVPDIPSVEELISAVLDAPAGRTRRKAK